MISLSYSNIRDILWVFALSFPAEGHKPQLAWQKSVLWARNIPNVSVGYTKEENTNEINQTATGKGLSLQKCRASQIKGQAQGMEIKSQ